MKLFDPHAVMTGASLQVLLHFAAEQGLAPELALARTRLSPEVMGVSHAEIEAWQELQVVRNLISALGQPALELGLQCGLRYHLGSYGMWGLALMTSATLGDAVRIGVQYIEVASYFNEIAVRAEGDRVTMTLDNASLPADVRAFLIGRDVASIGVILNTLLGTGHCWVKEIRIAYPAPAGAVCHALEELYHCSPGWHAGVTGISGDLAGLARRLPQANPVTSALCEAQCREQLQRLRSRRGLRGRLARLLLRESDASPTLDTAAASMGVSPRHLRRLLDQEGTCWRELKHDTRMRLAERLLQETDGGLQDIAVRLGYSDASAFSHAFKRWKRASPEQYRAGLRQHRSEHLAGVEPPPQFAARQALPSDDLDARVGRGFDGQGRDGPGVGVEYAGAAGGFDHCLYAQGVESVHPAQQSGEVEDRRWRIEPADGVVAVGGFLPAQDGVQRRRRLWRQIQP